MKTPNFVADIKVGSKTIEEIKKWLACWAVTYTDECSGECETCEYDVGEKESVGMGGKTLAYIQQLESRLAQVERERDAAVSDLRYKRSCLVCANNHTCQTGTYECNGCTKYSCPCRYCDFKWRGVCPENTKED